MKEKLFIRPTIFLNKQDMRGCKDYIEEQLERGDTVISIPPNVEVCIAPEDIKVEFLDWR